ncbi:hypothetical protein EXU57_14335 [Segetibacter sp. 3557_3]|uniref:succinylglutamate desuccinylase/aspartoacylase family protein n=1 Tax=Segetibacter sp. 3557_3 TaxID=2547429 RepID=UPI00105883BE|nr:succinylglutamate desuccinylase/aspartoacylase family protein [Segetibacter sp. 3557_3]TDH24520.1 hypothetical protein EXU57_14335 [Segetibacter sp. 3557_3]
MNYSSQVLIIFKPTILPAYQLVPCVLLPAYRARPAYLFPLTSPTTFRNSNAHLINSGKTTFYALASLDSFTPVTGNVMFRVTNIYIPKLSLEQVMKLNTLFTNIICCLSLSIGVKIVNAMPPSGRPTPTFLHAFDTINTGTASAIFRTNYLDDADGTPVDAPFSGNVQRTILLGSSVQGRSIEAWYFPGTSTKRALVVGGVHGSELSAIEVAKQLVKDLKNGAKPYYSVIVIPCLFPDNAAAARSKPGLIGSTDNHGRYTHPHAVDPNRQMPSPGKIFSPDEPVDHLNRRIENENRLLLSLINEFKPERMVNLHAIRDVAHAGFFADPRTDASGVALGFGPDSMLAIDMAKWVHAHDGYAPGNNLNGKATALYRNDPAPAAKGAYQPRNRSGSALPNNRGRGVSMGTWATTAVQDSAYGGYTRDAISLITVEFPGSKRPIDYASKKQREFYQEQVDIYAAAIAKVFLKSTVPDQSIVALNE